MHDFIKRQTEEFMNAAKAAQMPENMLAFAQESVAKTREAYDKLSSVARDQAKAAEEFVLATQAGAKAISTRVFDHAAANTDAAFDAAQAMAKARSLPEAVRLQGEFVQKQLAVAGEQTKELFELSARVTQQALQTANEAAAKSFEQIKKAI